VPLIIVNHDFSRHSAGMGHVGNTHNHPKIDPLSTRTPDFL